MADLSLQLQADNLPREQIEQLLVGGHWAPILARLETGENLLLEGCRGVGKTMLMRACATRLSVAARGGARVLGVHTTFKRYLASIPPPGMSTENELGNFKAWVNSRILQALTTQLADTFGSAGRAGRTAEIDWARVIRALETTYRARDFNDGQLRDAGLTNDEIRALKGYTFTVEALTTAREAFGLDLVVLLLDDAAHALDTRAQGEFFTLIKSLYAPRLAFKIAVYPAVTRYGLDFSYGHDAVVVSLSDVPSPTVMPSYIDLLRRRAGISDPTDPSSSLITHLLTDHADWVRLLVYSSNGNPRALLKLLAQVLTSLGERGPNQLTYEDIRGAINYVMDRHLENMVPGIIKDLDPRLMQAAQLLLDAFRDKIRDNPGPLQGTQPRMYLAITNSMQIPYICTAATRLLVAANVITSQGPVRLGTRTRENGTVFLLHPGFVFRDNVLALGGGGSSIPADRWLQHFDAMSPRVHAEISKTAPLWEEIRREAKMEPSRRCVNGHPVIDTASVCEQCGAPLVPKGPAEILLEKDVSELDLSQRLQERLRENGFTTVRKVFEATPEEIDAIPYVGLARREQIRSAVEAAVDEYFAG